MKNPSSKRNIVGRLILTILISFTFLISSGQIPESKNNADSNNTSIKVTLLGTGDPQPIMDRFGPSVLIQAGDQTLIFDVGRGCLQRLHQINISYNTLNAIFITHLHSDHIVGIPDLWLTGWLISKRSIPLKIFGPEGTPAMIMNLRKAYAFDIKMRIEDDKALPEGNKLTAVILHEGVVYEKNGVRVIAFLVDHYPIVPAFGFRIEYHQHSVVLSGDTRYCENLIKFAKGTDLLVHEVVISPDSLSHSDPKYHIFAHHTTPEQAGIVFSKVKPKLAVYSHIVSLYGHGADELDSRTRVNYSGPLMTGTDLMSFSIGDTILIHRER